MPLDNYRLNTQRICSCNENQKEIKAYQYKKKTPESKMKKEK